MISSPTGILARMTHKPLATMPSRAAPLHQPAPTARCLGVSIACLLCSTALSAPLLAQRVQLKDALPANSTIYLSFPDLSSSISELREMPVGRMWAEGEVQDFLADGMKWVEDRWAEGLTAGNKLHEEGKLPLKPETLLGLRIKSASLGVTSLSLELPEGASEPLPDFGIYALIDFGDSAATWQQIFEALLAEASQDPDVKLADSKSMVGDIQLRTIQPEVEGLEMSLNIAFVGDSVLIGTREDETRKVLENLQALEKSGAKKEGLSASASYQEVSKNLSLPGAETEFYFRTDAIFDLLMDVVDVISAETAVLDSTPEQTSIRDTLLNPEGIERAIAAMGLRALKACGSSSSYTGGRCVTRSYTKMDPQLRRGLTAYTESNLDMDFLRWVPKDAVQFSAMTIDVGSYYDALVDGLEALSPEIAEQALGMLEGFEQQLGVSLRDDLFGSFGHRVITWSMPMSGMGATPEMAILIEVNNQDKLMKALEIAETMSQGLLEVEAIDRRGFKAHQIHVNMPNDAGVMPFNPFDLITPTFVFEKGFMVIGFTTGDVKRTLKRMSREDEPDGDIRSNEEFIPYSAKLPKQGLSSVSFTDWKAQFEGYYQMATSLLGFVPMNQEIPIDLALLPDSYSLTQHLCGSISWVHSSPEGQESMAIGPWGPEITMTLGLAVSAGLVAPLTLAASRIEGRGGK